VTIAILASALRAPRVPLYKCDNNLKNITSNKAIATAMVTATAMAMATTTIMVIVIFTFRRRRNIAGMLYKVYQHLTTKWTRNTSEKCRKILYSEIPLRILVSRFL
jgi:hypothetical protein